jgi:hypothetical protein
MTLGFVMTMTTNPYQPPGTPPAKVDSDVANDQNRSRDPKPERGLLRVFGSLLIISHIISLLFGLNP